MEIGLACSFFSLPILAVYYNTLYYLAHAIVPASDPEKKEEKKQRFHVFFWYTWGLQHPLQVVSSDDRSGRTVETRIRGNMFSNTGKPGIIWLKSHQAAALTAGINFSRVEGPRVVFYQTLRALTRNCRPENSNSLARDRCNLQGWCTVQSYCTGLLHARQR